MFERLITLIGEDNLNKISSKKILLIGVGGVGSMALETLVRNGFNNITIVDCDKIELSNLNRQIITNSQNIGNSKVIAGILRSKEINPDILIDGIEKRLESANIDEILKLNYDYIIDACDDINVKFKLMEGSLHYNYKLITCLGTAKKIDPTKLSITTLDKTSYDPLARILRKKVKDAKINKKFYCISSTEKPVNIKELGTLSLVPNTAGILCVSFIINDILNNVIKYY